MTGRPVEHVVRLTEEERVLLRDIIQKGTHKARYIRRAHVLLLSDEGRLTNQDIARALGTARGTVTAIQARYVAEGLATTLPERPREGRPHVWTPRDDALLTTLACSEAPDGHSRWTLRLLQDRFVELSEDHASISHERIRQSLKKTSSNRGSASGG